LPTFPSVTGKRQVSSDGGRTPIWSVDGREIFYRQPPDAMMAVPVTRVGQSVEIGTPVKLGLSEVGVSLLVASDGKRFLVFQSAPGDGDAPVQVIRNWSARLTSR
jgi:hypothetical protein